MQQSFTNISAICYPTKSGEFSSNIQSAVTKTYWRPNAMPIHSHGNNLLHSSDDSVIVNAFNTLGRGISMVLNLIFFSYLKSYKMRNRNKALTKRLYSIVVSVHKWLMLTIANFNFLDSILEGQVTYAILWLYFGARGQKLNDKIVWYIGPTRASLSKNRLMELNIIIWYELLLFVVP